MLPPADVDVTSVIASGDTTAVWNFDTDVTAAAGDGPELEIDTGAGFTPAIGIVQTGPSTVLASYADAVASGMAYRILSQVTGLSFTDGHLIAIPQTGFTEE